MKSYILSSILLVSGYNIPVKSETVMASYYGHGENLQHYTSSGERFNPKEFTAAHRTLPFGTRVKVSIGNRSVIVKINDRGPARYTGRDIDLSYSAARELGLLARGTGRVQLEILY